MKLTTTVFWSALATIIRLATGFVSVKFVAVKIGPLGVGLVGQFGNFSQIIMTLALGGVSSGLIKFTSQFKDNTEELYQIWRTIIWISGVMIIIISVFMILFHNWLALVFLHDKKFGIVFIIFAFSLIFFVANSLMLNILNGLHQIQKFNLLNSLNSVLALGVTLALVNYLHLIGAILSLVTSQAVTFFVIIFFVARSDWFKPKAFFGKFNLYYFKQLMGFTAMSITSICVIPTSQMFVRTYLANHSSWEIAGCWQGVQKISDSYLMVVYTALGTYFLPKLSSLSDTKLIHQEIINGYLKIMPFVLISALSIYIFRNLIINLLFSHDFFAMRTMFFWQLLGDCFKIASYMLAYLLLAKAKTRLFIFSEIFFGITFPLFSYLLINFLGSSGAVMAFALNYFLYFMFMIYLYKKGHLL